MNNNPIYEKEFALLIDAYRKSIYRRYSTDNIQRFPELQGIDQKTVDKLTYYFLELLYPEHSERLKLDEAFLALSRFIHSPEKLFGLVGSIGTILFKFGKLFFAAAKAGVSALRSYLTAHKFEHTMYEEAKLFLQRGQDINDPTIFDSLIAKIPKREADAFREQVVSLFTSLTKQELLEKIVEVMEYVIHKMQSKPDLYGKDDISGIELGKSIIIQGKKIFEELSDKEIKLVLKGVDTIEKDFYDRAVESTKRK